MSLYCVVEVASRSSRSCSVDSLSLRYDKTGSLTKSTESSIAMTGCTSFSFPKQNPWQRTFSEENSEHFRLWMEEAKSPVIFSSLTRSGLLILFLLVVSKGCCHT